MSRLKVYNNGNWEYADINPNIITTTIDSTSTNDKAPGAKAVYDAIQAGGGISDWSEIQNKPSTFPPSNHNHNDLYYTESEIDTALNNKHDTINATNKLYSKFVVGAGTSEHFDGDTVETALDDLYDMADAKYTKPNGGIPASDLAQSYALSSNLASHTGNTNNPHNVTKEQVGLGHVNNVTLEINYSGNPPDTETLQNITDNTNGVKYTVPQGTYSKPSSGIPKSDLAYEVKEGLHTVTEDGFANINKIDGYTIAAKVDEDGNEIKINYATKAEVTSGLSSKAASNHTHDDRYYTETEVDTALSGKASASSVTTIEGKIPAQATSSNQLADKDFVNSSIATNTAYYISNSGEPFSSLAQLQEYSGTVTNNDYAFVTGTDSDGNTFYDRYKATVNDSTITWAKEFRLNNSSFTAAQWASITSGITSALISSYNTHIADSDIHITSSERTTWNNKGTYSKPADGIPASDIATGVIPTKTSDLTNDSDFISTNTIEDIEEITVETAVSTSSNLITSGAVKTYVDAQVATKENIGKLTVGGTEYTVITSTTDEGTAGYITFVLEGEDE